MGNKNILYIHDKNLILCWTEGQCIMMQPFEPRCRLIHHLTCSHLVLFIFFDIFFSNYYGSSYLYELSKAPPHFFSC